MTRDKFKTIIETSGDIMFDCLDKHYTILTWTDNGITIGEQNNDNDDMVFKSADDLINNYLINGKPLSDIIDNIVITFVS